MTDKTVEEETFIENFATDPITPLMDGFKISDLIKEGTTFEINTELGEEPPELPLSTCFLSHNFFTECPDDDDDSDSDLSPFAKLAKKMVNVDPDGYVKKRIITPGTGDKITDKAKVVMHFDAYIEYGDEPFNSTVTSRPKAVRLGVGEILPGLEIAVASMENRETAQILIEPEMAFGTYGLINVVPPNSQVLYRVEIIQVIDAITADIYEKIEDEERKKFSTIRRVADGHQNQGKAHFERENYKAAIRSYNSAINILESAPLLDMSEQEIQQRTLIKLFTNLAICYNKQNQPNKTCLMVKRIYEITENNGIKPSDKVYFHHGRALIMIGDFKRARSHLLKAKAINPDNQFVLKEIAKLEELINDNKIKEKEFVMRAFESEIKPTYDLSSLDESFVQKVHDFLAYFKNSSAHEQELPDGFTLEEIQCFEMKAYEASLGFKKIVNQNEVVYKIFRKPN